MIILGHPILFLVPECAPDLSNPMSAATYAAEEIAEAKDGFVRYFSDEDGKTYHCERCGGEHLSGL